MKKTVLHFIYDLGRGGAETMLVQVLKNLEEYNNIVVTVGPLNFFESELQCSQFICLNQRSVLFSPFTSVSLRRIIKQYNVDIVHTHLFWPTVIARMGVPRKVPLITTIHTFIPTALEYKKWYIRVLDKISYGFRKSVIIGVSKAVTKEYFSFLNIKPYKAYPLYTFVDISRFNITHDTAVRSSEPFRLISVGALRGSKNFAFLIEAFKQLKHDHIELHIFGRGPLQQKLQKAIDDAGVNVVLKGQIENVNEVLPRYDLCVMSSIFEGFSIGVLETMAAKVPMLLSDIVSFHEQCEDTAEYFDLQDVNDFTAKLRSLVANEPLRLQMSESAYKRVVNNFTLEHHMRELRNIYLETLNNN